MNTKKHVPLFYNSDLKECKTKIPTGMNQETKIRVSQSNITYSENGKVCRAWRMNWEEEARGTNKSIVES